MEPPLQHHTSFLGKSSKKVLLCLLIQRSVCLFIPSHKCQISPHRLSMYPLEHIISTLWPKISPLSSQINSFQLQQPSKQTSALYQPSNTSHITSNIHISPQIPHIWPKISISALFNLEFILSRLYELCRPHIWFFKTTRPVRPWVRSLAYC